MRKHLVFICCKSIYWLYVLENILICSTEHSSNCSLQWPVAWFFCLLLSYHLYFFLQLRLSILNFIFFNVITYIIMSQFCSILIIWQTSWYKLIISSCFMARYHIIWHNIAKYDKTWRNVVMSYNPQSIWKHTHNNCWNKK